MLIVLALVIIAHGLDYASTRYALHRGAVEANPIVRSNIRLAKSIGTGVSAGMAVLAYSVDHRTGYIAAVLIFVFYAWVAFRNVRIVRKHH